MAVIERPYKFCFSKNEVRYVFQLTSLDRPNLSLQVRLYWLDIGSSTDNLLYQFSLKPDANGFVYLFIQGYLNSLLTYVMPDVTNQFTNANAQAKQFYITFREVDDDTPNPDWVTTESTHKAIVLRGGIEKYKHRHNNYFINYQEQYTPFLSWQPDGRVIFADEPAYLTFLRPAITTNDLLLNINAADTNGTSYTKSINVPNGSILVHIAVDPASLGLPALVPGIMHYYDVSIVDAAGNVYAKPYRFFIEYRPLYKWFDFVFHNSLGGIDFVRAKGETTLSIDRATEDGEAGINVNDWQEDVRSHEALYTTISLRRTFKGDVGFLRTPEQRESLIELLSSKSIYQLIDSRWIPVLNMQKGTDYAKTTDKTFVFPVEWGLSESNEVFTPWNKNFGKGN